MLINHIQQASFPQATCDGVLSYVSYLIKPIVPSVANQLSTGRFSSSRMPIIDSTCFYQYIHTELTSEVSSSALHSPSVVTHAHLLQLCATLLFAPMTTFTFSYLHVQHNLSVSTTTYELAIYN